MTTEKIVLDAIKSTKNKIINNPSTTQKSEKTKQSQEVLKNKLPDHNDNSKINVINAHGRNSRLNIMVIGAALGLIFCLLMLTSYRGDLPGEVIGIISTVSGIFGACLKDAYSFEFGSSRGSKDKDDKISSTILEKIKTI
ncbi:MAG: hypothetical protein LBB25_04590 [Holosporaceae bacterium]|jgi:hypothetical protein|nr:hypothetical protein [Holosporaceae bacterium]